MPNALLFGCDKELAKRLARDPRWKVALATHCHAGKGSNSLPSPMRWNLLVDDCLHPPVRHIDPGKPDVIEGNDEPTDEDATSLGLRLYRVPDSYLREATRAHGIRFCTNEDEYHEVRTRPHSDERHMPLEFNEADPRALHVATVVETFASSFRRGYLWNINTGALGTPLFRDFYGHPTITVSRGPRDPGWLFLIDILDKKKRIEALWQLCVRVAPKLWPDLYAGSFHARRVRRLRDRQSQLTALYRAEMERIDAQAEEEERFFGPFYNLLYVGDEALVDLAMKVFTQVLHCDVENLDDQVTADEWRTLDLLVRCEVWDAFVEVKGSTNRNAKIGDLEQLDDHYETASRRYGQAKSRILIFNGMYGRPEDERLRDATFSSQVIDEAETRSITLVDTRDLLDAIDRIRNGELAAEKLIDCLGTPGRLALPLDS